MSVLIKGMEMPTSCFECRFSIDGFCYASGHVNIRANEKRQVTNYCPLVPIPPHGDLIDRNTAYDSLLHGMAMTGYQSRALDCISDFYAPTIIPAEEGE